MEGLIYKIQPYQEHARLLYVYTPKGKKTLLAQGSQKVNHPNRILAQYLTHIDFKDSTKSFIVLSEAQIINDFETLKKDFKQTQCAALILEIIDHVVVDKEIHEEIFHDMMLSLQAPNIFLSSLSFAVKILKPLGYGLDLSPDGRPIKGLSILRGGLVYEKEDLYIDLEVKDAVYLLKLSLMPYHLLEKIDDEALSRIKEFILKYYQFHLQTTLKNLQ
jgi:DNA repair protein RecO (recombination protein O)